MAVYKERNPKQYCKVPVEYLNNRELSLKERGMLATLSGLPENWVFSLTGLAVTMRDGISVIRSTYRSLIQKGYISANEVRGPNGRFGGTDLYLNIIPVLPDTPADDNPHAVKRKAGIRRESINKESRIHESTINESGTIECKSHASDVSRSPGRKPDGSNKRTFAGKKKKAPFIDFPQREYDYEDLEEKLTRAQNEKLEQSGIV